MTLQENKRTWLAAVLGAALLSGNLFAQAPQPAEQAQQPTTQALRPTAQPTTGQSTVGQTTIGQPTIQALLLSDLHFDPFHDPAKAQRLAAAPIGEWTTILSEPDSPDQAETFAALQRTCNARGVDTPYALLASSLRAERAQVPDARFVTLSGDLVTHGFTCRFATLVPGKTPADYAAFVEKTTAYVLAELRRTFPGIPLYTAFGNHDSGCGDYKLDRHSAFFGQTSTLIADALGPALLRAQRKQMLDSFADDGSYSIPMAAPMRDTRLIVLDNVFASTKYTPCSGHANAAIATTTTASGADAQNAWLQQQLTEAQQHGQHVWIIGHIPPGIDLYSTVLEARNICAGTPPEMFLGSGAMADTLLAHAGVIRLALFAHTHMDELRLLKPETGSGGEVALKMVSSISPVGGNNPSFTVARIDPASAQMLDYAVYSANNQTGIDTMWSRQYDFAATYHQDAFSPTALDHLTTQFQADRSAATPESRAYLRNYFAGGLGTELAPLWPAYVCSLTHTTAQGFAHCVCPAP